MPTHDLTFPSPASAGHGPKLTGQFARLGAILLHWHERARQRRQLADLDPWMLRDLGLTRLDVQRECAKPFWQL